MSSPGRRLVLDEPLPFDEAFALVTSDVPVLAAEEVGLADAWQRVLAESLTASEAIPPFDNSTVDGYAVRASDVGGASAANPVPLAVIGEIAAGHPGDLEVRPGTAIRIMTGAPIPPGCDCVVMLEWTEWSESSVRVERAGKVGQFVRRAGEDVSVGDTVLEPGTTLGAAELGVLASIGRARVPVHRRPRVAVLPTGNELLEVHEPLAPGRIRSSNDWSIGGQIREAGAEVVPLGIGRDDVGDLAARVERARGCDVLVTSGGVSVGDHDVVQDVLVDAGLEKVFWRVRSSPGKPLLFGRMGATLVFGLPGNPVSSMVSFENFVRPVLRRLQGDRNPGRLRVRAVARDELRGPVDRCHFARVRLAWGPGGFSVREVRPHGSGNLRSMVHANAFAIVPEGVASIAVGERVDVVVLSTPDPAGP